MKFPRDYLLDLLQYLGYLEMFAAEGRANLDSDVKTRLAVNAAYEVIGEILKRLPKSLLDQQPQVEWKSIKGFRDVLRTSTTISPLTGCGWHCKTCPICAPPSKC